MPSKERLVTFVRPPDDEELYRRGLAARHEGRLAEAREAFAELVDADAGDAGAWVALSQVARDMGDGATAQTALDMAARLGVVDPDGLLMQGERDLVEGRPLEALVAACRVLTLAPEYERALVLGRAALIQLGADHGEDNVDLERASPEARAMLETGLSPLARRLAEDGGWQEAVLGYGLLSRLDPASPTHLNDLGSALAMAAQKGEQVDDMTRLLLLGRALRCYLRGVELGPNDRYLFGNLGMFCHFMADKKMEAAAEASMYCLGQAFMLVPDDPLTRQAMADLFYGRRDLATSSAILAGGFPERLEDVLDETALPRFVESFFEAVETITNCREAAVTGDKEILERMGDALMTLGSRPLAALSFAIALREDPDDGRLRGKLGEVLLGGRLLHEAVAVFAADDSIQPPPLVALS